ncbi:MAG: asparagine synthase-related protein, partial [Syntrophomonas sp.]
PGHGIFRGIKELRPGYSLIYNHNGIRLHKYWSLQSRPHKDDLTTTAANVRRLLHDAVSRQLVADVPVCTFLSGGLDSSAITAFAAAEYRESGRDALHTYSVDYLGNDVHFKASSFQPDADALWVGKVAEYLNTEHHYINIDNLVLAEALEPALLANDMPGMADIDSSLYLFCREIKKAATVAVSGECADEIFGGYPWFFNERTLFADAFPWIRMVEERQSMLSPEITERINPRQYLADRYREAVAEVPRLSGEDEFSSRIRRLFYLNITRFMPTLLDRKDRMSMACGLEVRVPFSDHHLVEYVWNIPWEMKTCGQMAKGILRRALEGWLPPAVLTRRKSPYPKTHNPVYLTILRERVAGILRDSSSPLPDLINAPAVQKLITSSGSVFPQPYFGQLMGEPQYLAYLVQLDTWLRDYRVKIL